MISQAEDENGVCTWTAPALAQALGMELSRVEELLDVFQGTDKHSRSSELDGRRIIKLPDIGWKLVNYEKYRAKRDRLERKRQTREATRRWREQKGSPMLTDAHQKLTVSHVSHGEPKQKQKQYGTTYPSSDGSTPLRSVDQPLLENSQVLGENETDSLQEKAVSRESIVGAAVDPDETSLLVLAPEVAALKPKARRRRRREGDGPEAAPAPNYVSLACDDWVELTGGTAPGGRIGAALARLTRQLMREVPELEGVTREADVFERIRPVWRFYLQSEKAEYLSAQGFADRFGLWAQRMTGNENPDRGAKLSEVDRGLRMFLNAVDAKRGLL